MANPDRTVFFRKRIKEIRTSKDISPQCIAKIVGITEEEYFEIETGITEQIDLKTALNIAFVLDVNMNFLCGFTDEIKHNDLSTILNNFDNSGEIEEYIRTNLHEVILMDDEERKAFTEHLRKGSLLLD